MKPTPDVTWAQAAQHSQNTIPVLIAVLLGVAFLLTFNIIPAWSQRARRAKRERALNRAMYQEAIDEEAYWLRQLSRSAVPTYQEKEVSHVYGNR